MDQLLSNLFVPGQKQITSFDDFQHQSVQRLTSTSQPCRVSSEKIM